MKDAGSPVDFSNLRRSRRLPAPPEDASSNLGVPELASGSGSGVPADNLPGLTAGSPRPDERRRIVEPYVAPEPATPSVDGRARLKTGRTEAFSTRVRADFKPRLIAAANRHRCTMSEALERAIDALDRMDGV